jgi:predicted RNase H-like nuclease (RuvC/YqgF family)
MNESKNVLSLQVARERACQAKTASDRQISKRSNQRLLERLEAENAQLRDTVAELMLEIQALREALRHPHMKSDSE